MNGSSDVYVDGICSQLKITLCILCFCDCKCAYTSGDKRRMLSFARAMEEAIVNNAVSDECRHSLSSIRCSSALSALRALVPSFTSPRSRPIRFASSSVYSYLLLSQQVKRVFANLHPPAGTHAWQQIYDLTNDAFNKDEWKINSDLTSACNFTEQ